VLTNARTATTLPVVDLERAKTFYREKLGLKTSEDVPGGAMLEAGTGQRILLYQRERTKADHTVIGFEVEDVAKEVKELRGKGIVFEEYDMPDLKTVDSIATLGTWKAAWFKDTEGNILSINEMK
jgi:catechol 2,3-dioxygenase-like lactoylglutathione lyase family enzyme